MSTPFSLSKNAEISQSALLEGFAAVEIFVSSSGVYIYYSFFSDADCFLAYAAVIALGSIGGSPAPSML